jgi:hypothetical protein
MDENNDIEWIIKIIKERKREQIRKDKLKELLGLKF